MYFYIKYFLPEGGSLVVEDVFNPSKRSWSFDNQIILASVDKYLNIMIVKELLN